MPRPLSHFHPKGSVLLGNTGLRVNIPGPTALSICNVGDFPLETRPEILRSAMRLIASWSILDTYIARMFASMIGGQASPAMAMYQSLGSTNTQHTTLRAAAKVALTGRDIEYELLEALLSLYSKRVRLRNCVAHHLWGFSSSAPDGIVLLDPRIYPEIEGGGPIDYSKISVYELADFDEAVAKAMELSAWFHDLFFVIGPMRRAADHILPRLQAAPDVQSALRRLFEHHKNLPAADPAQPPKPDEGHPAKAE